MIEKIKQFVVWVLRFVRMVGDWVLSAVVWLTGRHVKKLKDVATLDKKMFDDVIDDAIDSVVAHKEGVDGKVDGETAGTTDSASKHD